MIANLEKMFKQADAIDMEEGLLAYQRYHMVMAEMSMAYSIELEKVIAVFVSLSPNNDYVGNLRSTVSVLAGISAGVPEEQVTISTYKHCRKRAFQYARGERNFLKETKGQKIINFFHNVLDPSDNRYVTIDGHMSAIWQNKNLTMKEAIVRHKREYNEISDAVKKLAFREMMLPNQLQAILWFTRKRVRNIKSENQFDLLLPKGDLWRTIRNLKELRPYPCAKSTQRKNTPEKLLHSDPCRLELQKENQLLLGLEQLKDFSHF